MASQWYYTQDYEQHGPVDSPTLKQLAMTGQLQPYDLVWKAGMPDWMAAEKVRGLFVNTPAMVGASVQSTPAEAPVPAMRTHQASARTHQGPVGLSYRRVRQPEYEYAGIWLRFVAAVVDGFLLFFISFAMGFILGFVMAIGGADQQIIGLLGNIAGTVVGWLYFALQESSANQATMGKRAVGIMVTDLNGERLSFGRATGRHFAKFLSMIILFVGYLMAAFTSRRQALHDIIAGALVVKQ
jgi:uncharacterized RDD family membrane protein YckC